MADEILQLGEALAYEDCLPVKCKIPDPGIEPSMFVGLNARNEEVLQNILMLEKHHAELSENDAGAGAPFSHELAHIDFKVNLLLELMVQVFSDQLSIPTASPFMLTTSHLQCISKQTVNVGDSLFVDLFLNRRFPRPLTLYGCVSSVEPREKGICSVILDLDHISLSVRALLERFIFLKHRRNIALSKRE